MALDVLINLPEDFRRKALFDLVEYSVGWSRSDFDHMFMSAGEHFSGFIVSCGLATDTGVGFKNLVPLQQRREYFFDTSVSELPCLYRALDAALGMALQYDGDYDETGPYERMILPKPLRVVFWDLGLVDEDGHYNLLWEDVQDRIYGALRA